MWPHRQGTHLCHVTWVRTYTRSLVNVEILAIKRHGHSVHLDHSNSRPRTRRPQAAHLVRVNTYIYGCYLCSLVPITLTSVQAPIVSDNRHLPTTTAMKLTITAFLALAASAVALPQWWGGFPPIGLMCGGCQKSCADLTRMEGGDLTTCLRKNCPPNVRFLTFMITARGLA